MATMATTPTDRGFVVMDLNSDGTTTVMVCAAVEHGKPVNVYALYRQAPKIIVGPGLRMVREGNRQYTRQVVEVFPASTGGVYVRLPTRSLVP
jgi:hypothetical protein